MPGATRLRIYCAALAAAVSLLICAWSLARVKYVYGGNFTGLFQHGTDFPVPPKLEAGTFYQEGTGYDGQFYRMLAHDPLLRNNVARYCDSPQLRFRRLLIPGLAWALSGGQKQRIDPMYFGLEMVFLALGIYWTGLLFARRGGSPLWGLLFVTVPAVLASFDRMVLDGPLTALFAGFVLYAEEGRWGRVWLLAMLAALTRETGLLLAGGVVVDALLRRDWRRAAWFSMSAIPAISWYLFLASRLPADRAVSIFSLPVLGILQRLFWLRPYPDPALRMLLLFTDLFAVLGLAVSLYFAIQWLRQDAVSPVTICVALFAAMGLCLGSTTHMVDAFGFGRPVSPLLLWLMLEAFSRRQLAVVAAPLLISASVSLVFLKPAVAIAKGILGR